MLLVTWWSETKTVLLPSQALRDLDFEVRDKMIVESILDIEFQDPTISDKAIFYSGKKNLDVLVRLEPSK